MLGYQGMFPVSFSSKLSLCSANDSACYFSNLACDWLSIPWAYSKQETETDNTLNKLIHSIAADALAPSIARTWVVLETQHWTAKFKYSQLWWV